LYAEYSAKGVAFLMADFSEEGERNLPGFLAQFRPAWPTGFCDRGAAMEFLQLSIMNQGYVPKLALIDRSGQIRYQYQGQDAIFERGGHLTLRSKLDELLAMKPPPTPKPTPPKPAAPKPAAPKPAAKK
jgi:hypothetical protein